MLHLHRSADADVLVCALGEVLATPAGDPFAPEIVAVGAKGVERWLAQRLSHLLGAGSAGDGVCANVRFDSPTRLLDGALHAVEAAAGSDPDPWDPQRAVWPLLDLLDAGVGGDRVSAHVATGDRRYAVAARLSALFATYGQERPELLRRWAQGHDDDGSGTTLPEDLAWQPQLWRVLRTRIGVPSPAERLTAAVAALRDDPDHVDLPDRLSLFGLTRLSHARLEVLAALAHHREVRLWIQHPSPALWAAVAQQRPLRHPVLRSMSRDVQGLQRRILLQIADHVEHELPAPTPAPGLLGELQRSLAGDTIPAPAERLRLDPADTSIGIHACHGRARQVEVLREIVLDRLAMDASLELRDIVVLCPDVEEFAPLVAAAFGLSAPTPSGSDAAGGRRGPSGPDLTGDQTTHAHPATTLTVRLADRALRQANPLFATLARLLELGRGRMRSTDVLDFAATAAVRHRFGFDAEDLERLNTWVHQAQICWGMDALDRERFQLRDAPRGTWRDGIDRLLLGIAMEENGAWLGPTVPLDDVDSADIDLAGRFAELLDRLDAATREFATPRSAAAWMQLLTDAVFALAAPGPGEGWQSSAVAAELDAIREQAAQSTTLLTVADVHALLAPRLAGRPTRASFRTGALTVATLVPMRAVPHRVVILLGLDDTAFPRAGIVDGDDLLARDPRPGERDPRSEDRQLFLDALCSAREHVAIVYSGADERSGAPIPPAVPVGELIDVLDAVAVGADGSPASVAVTTYHPLQAFDPRNFGIEPAAGNRGRAPTSFDTAALAGARALVRPRRAPTPLIADPLPPVAPDDVDLGDVVRLLTHPARGFLRQRLQLTLSGDDGDPPDALPIELDGLAEWDIGERLLAERLRGLSIQTCRELELRRAALPPGSLGDQTLRRIGPRVDAITALVNPEQLPTAQARDIDLAVTDAGRRLVGTVPEVRGLDILRVSYSTVRARHRLAAWIELLALSAMNPERAWRAAVVGRRRNAAARCTLGPVAATQARQYLAALIELRDRGLGRPLPLPVATAERYAANLGRGMDHRQAFADAADQEWAGRFPERDDPAHVLVYGRERPLRELDEREFAELAVAVWQPLLAHEQWGR